MKKISAEIVADSINQDGNRITSFILTYPRFIHGELMTHRLFSRNSASSRAIPFKTMIKMVEEDPFIPIAWQKDHKGMQGTEYFTDVNDLSWLKMNHLKARDQAIERASDASDRGLTKQLCNRLLEPFMWHTVLVTATEYDNFFDLRCPSYKIFSENVPMVFKSKKDLINYVKQVEADEFKNQYDNLYELDWIKISESQAEIHIQALAETMWDSLNESTPKQLKSGEWHIPFGDKMDNDEIYKKLLFPYNFDYNQGRIDLQKISIATARCARLSYMTFDGEINYEKDIKLHDSLFGPPFHASPFEHCCKCPTDLTDWENGFTHCDKEGNLWSGNVKGWIQYRHLLNDGK